MRTQLRSGFTLIELLIVVAIIAILAAIAVPNFLEAQVRAKVSRAKNDMRTQATGLETYYVDHNTYTRDSDSDLDIMDGGALPENVRANGAIQLTTPIAYMSGLLSDPFSQGLSTSSSGGVAIGYRIGSGSWSYDPAAIPTADTQDSHSVFVTTGGKRATYVTLSVGPDQARERIGYKCFPFKSTASSEQAFYMDYDPTNGTTSRGDLYRFGGQFLQGNWDRNWTNAGPRGPEAN